MTKTRKVHLQQIKGSSLDTKHTPTPWMVNGKGEPGNTGHTCHRFNWATITIPDVDNGGFHSSAIEVNGTFAHEDAAFIVRACNSHDALIEALGYVLHIATHDDSMDRKSEKQAIANRVAEALVAAQVQS